MELTAYDLALIAGGFTIAGALIAVIAGHWLGKKLSQHSYKLQRLDEIRSTIISHYRNFYPVATKWPDDIRRELDQKSPFLCELIQQCKTHVGTKDFEVLISVRDEFLNTITDQIAKNNESAEILYNRGNPRKGQAKLHEYLDKILEHIK